MESISGDQAFVPKIAVRVCTGPDCDYFVQHQVNYCAFCGRPLRLTYRPSEGIDRLFAHIYSQAGKRYQDSRNRKFNETTGDVSVSYLKRLPE